MSGGWHIRCAVDADASALQKVIAAAYGSYAAHIGDLPDVTEGIEEEIATHLTLVAVQNSNVGGGIVLVCEDSFLQVANIAVAPVHSGRGLGRLLMERGETEAHRLGYSEMRLSTHVGMPENVALYTHLGWRETGRSGAKVFMNKSL